MSEPFLDAVRRSWLLFSVLLLLLGMVGWSIWTQHKLVGKIAAMENTLSTPIPVEYEEDLNQIEAQGVKVMKQYQKEVLKEICTAAMENILSTPIPAEYEEDLKRIEAQGVKALEQYQKEALEEIRNFEREFQRVSKEVSQASILNRWEDKHYEAIQKAIISYLLPIDLDLLELPVQKLYRQEFERGWGNLGGIKRQTIVAEKSILTPKKKITVPEGQS